MLRAADKYTPEAFSKVHNDRYSYDRYVYSGAEKPAVFTCPEHGDFESLPYTHLKGTGCPQCGIERSAESKRITQEEFISRCTEVHGGIYDYSLVEYEYARKHINIICPIHGVFRQIASSHINGRGCKACADAAEGVRKKEQAARLFVEKARLVHEGWDYSNVVYKGNNRRVEMTCPYGHTVWQTPANHLTGYGCNLCTTTPLHQRLHVALGGIPNVRGLLDNTQEIDLYFPDKKIGIELNGVYWHSEKMIEQRRDAGTARNYHQRKIEAAAEKGIDLYHLWIDTETDEELISSWIRGKLGMVDRKIPARKTEVREITSKVYKKFLTHTHLQGPVTSRVKLGLFHENELVATMGFSLVTGEWFLDRFSSSRGTVIQGGFSKLLSHFAREHSPSKVISFSDDSYSRGGVYLSNGFTAVGKSTSPRLYYTDGRILHHRQRFQRKHIHARRPDIPWGSERSMAEAEGFYPLWGCRTTRWEKTYPVSL